MSREAFEAWGSANGYESKTGKGMDYPLGRALWIAWQAARAAALEEARQEIAMLRELHKAMTGECEDGCDFVTAWETAEQVIRALKEK